MITEKTREIAATLASRYGVEPVRTIQALKGGANNQVFEVHAQERVFLKIYFRHPHDQRDRLKAEFEFCEFAWNQGLRQVPRPLVRDPLRGAALYELLEGRRLTHEEVTEARVQEALRFFQELNQHKAQANHLRDASDACFSLEEHLESVERRVQQLRRIDGSTARRRETARFVECHLLPTWQRVSQGAAAHLNSPVATRVREEERCLSPSDFGFHNAFLMHDGRMRFFDFEYAGWDDPAKLVCDFFCQPTVPAPLRLLDSFIQTILAQFSHSERLQQRIALLLPVYRIKWCCILLNEFLPAGGARRRFADDSLVPGDRECTQLSKAQVALANAIDSSVGH